jgi:phage terminase Nu1 subunit (DNA packaging protein)
MAQQASYPLATIAKLLMLTDRRVQQLAKEGHIPRAERGRYELVPAVQGYVRYLRDRAINGDVGEGGEASDRARLIKARADIAEMEAQRLAEDLVSVGDVERATADMVARFRARSLAIPSKAAPMVAMEETTEACHEIIETFVHEALAELSVTAVESRGPIGGADEAGDAGGSTPAEADDLGMG